MCINLAAIWNVPLDRFVRQYIFLECGQLIGRIVYSRQFIRPASYSIFTRRYFWRRENTERHGDWLYGFSYTEFRKRGRGRTGNRYRLLIESDTARENCSMSVMTWLPSAGRKMRERCINIIASAVAIVSSNIYLHRSWWRPEARHTMHAKKCVPMVSVGRYDILLAEDSK